MGCAWGALPCPAPRVRSCLWNPQEQVLLTARAEAGPDLHVTFQMKFGQRWPRPQAPRGSKPPPRATRGGRGTPSSLVADGLH